MKRSSGAGHLWRLAWVVALSTLAPLGLGLWLDRRFGMAPLFVLIGSLVGITAATIGVVLVATRAIDALGRVPETAIGAEEDAIGKEA
jgi:F0F1-type ATP synthase assembly protein I